MSCSIRVWLASYLLRVAENWGGNLSTVPLEEKSKKVQILEFLALGAENEDSAIWARISDKEMTIPVKFNKEAVMAYNQSTGRRMTENRTALVSIKKFKPMSTRVPNRNRGMSAEPQLALHCEAVALVGSVGEPHWGSPKEIESHVDLGEWSLALRQDGGAGNVLKERKKAREREDNMADARSPARRPVSMRKPAAVHYKPQVLSGVGKEPMHEYRKRWNVCFDTSTLSTG
ncbi:hypothetical protein B0H10DRAFT_451443 [Mycena sp. CBHHK59/15]|nr:hypothetical protein B0H10DRAFT_451443 [Mycena sp. CBHHK59/15]